MSALTLESLPMLMPQPTHDDEEHAVAVVTDVAPLRMAAMAGGKLATIIGIEGGFSRGVGAQLAICGAARSGDLADHCLESAIVAELQKPAQARVLRFGRGSPFIDLQLACGGGIDVLIEPAPDIVALRRVVSAVEARQGAVLDFTLDSSVTGRSFRCQYLPPLRLIIVGAGSEVSALRTVARAAGFDVQTIQPHGAVHADAYISLGATPDIDPDWRCAVIVLFHDHEWERTVLPWALRSPARYVGVQGSQTAQHARAGWLSDLGLAREAERSLRAPVGLIKRTRSPQALAVSILAEIVEFESSQANAALADGALPVRQKSSLTDAPTINGGFV